MRARPGEGERRAAGGLRPQYLVGAATVHEALVNGDLEWIRVADPQAGRVDDLQVACTGRVDAYQVKWAQYGGTITLRDLIHDTDKEPSLIAQLADGWRRLRILYPHRRIIVHLATNRYPSTSTQGMPKVEIPPTPYHLAAFIEQAWLPASRERRIDPIGPWAPLWEAIRTASGLSAEEFSKFVVDCVLDFQTPLPKNNSDVEALANLLFATAAGAERIIELSRDELLRRLGWQRRYIYRNKHEFPAPEFMYRPIQKTVEAVEAVIRELPGGYIGIFGPPGSGKSTLLTRTLRAIPLRLVRYYAYVPEAQDPSIRGEAINFLHDVTLRLQEAGFVQTARPDPTDRSALLDLFHQQLQALGRDFTDTGTKSVFLIDGLDHIAREQHPERSLLHDLPLPEAVPGGVYIVLGSQTDELPDLPPRVHHVLKQSERRIEMERLSPSDVHTIALEAVPGLNIDERQQIFELSGGHPLALIYLLKPLCQVDLSQERAQILVEATPYEGDIEQQYWGHWRAIENDPVLVHTLGLLARVRGPIPMNWIAQWSETETLRKLQRLFLTYFQQEGENHWVFFHNSFRLFLAARTIEPLPGQSPDLQNQVYHRELATRYGTSPLPWRWEALYHQFSAGEYSAVVEMATPEWFLEQVEALRPLDAIQTDARLALQAAGMCEDITALAKLTLIGAALEQRVWTLEDRALPELLLKAGEAVQSAEHLRDGNRLRVNGEQALHLSSRLSEAGLEREGRRIFELAEPLELLSGRSIPDDHTRPQNLWELLRAWVRSATVFRPLEEMVQVIRRIRIEPERRGLEKETAEQSSWQFQSWLLFHGALACCERGNWTGWQILFNALDEQRDREQRFFVLLRSAERVDAAGDTDRARSLLDNLLAAFQWQDLEVVDGQRRRIQAGLDVAELALRVTGDEAVAQAWCSNIAPIPLQDESLYDREETSLHTLRFRKARLDYLFGDIHEPEVLLKEAELHTNFGRYVEDEKKKAYRQIALAAYQLAKLWARGHCGFGLQPVTFLHEVRWILDLFGPGFSTWPISFRAYVGNARSDILHCVVSAAVKQGDAVVIALKETLETRWTDPKEGTEWQVDLQRKLLMALTEVGVDQAWAKAQLHRIEPEMLRGLDPYGRVEACEAQAEAWLALGERDAAVTELRRMVKASRGIMSEKDYQLPNWVDWLGRINKLEPDQAKDRIRLMLRRIINVYGSASGASSAAETLLEVVFQWSPRRSVRLLKELLESHITGHQDGVTRVLKGALNSQEPPISEVLYSVVDLILPLVPGTEPDLVKWLIVQLSNRLGFNVAVEVANYLVHRIKIDVLANNRPGWYHGVIAGLQEIGANPSLLGLEPSELEERSTQSSSQIDENLYLKSGEQFKLEEVLVKVQIVADLHTLLEQKDQERTKFFNWSAVVEHLIPKLSSIQELNECESFIEAQLNKDHLSRSLIALSKRFLELGDRASAWTLAERALKATEASGWDPYWDGGRRHAALRQLIAIDVVRAHKRAIKLYAHDLSERFRYPGRIILHFYDVLTLLTGEVPIKEIWSAIEIYLDDLFGSIPVEPQPAFESLLEEPVGKSGDDTSVHAVADLLTLYLDHPSFPVAQGAVRACTATLLNGSQVMAIALEEISTRSDEAAERALMVLDAVSMEEPVIVEPFSEMLERFSLSPNFVIRLMASVIRTRIGSESPIPPVVERDLPAIYTLHLPQIALHKTEEAVKGKKAPIIITDPALVLSPLDIEGRAIAEAAELPEDNVLYRAAQYFRTLETRRTWLTENSTLTPKRLSTFLDQVGLRHTHNKPHITPARQALTYVMAELYDGGYFPPESLHWLSKILIHYDPAFILWRPDQRPMCIDHMGGIPVNDRAFISLPSDWTETAEDSFSLLRPRASDNRIILAEWTRLRYLQDEWPEEERMAVVRTVAPVEIWKGINIEDGHPPYIDFRGVQMNNYLYLHASLDHLVIAHNGYEFETPGARWLAFNPAVGHVLGWQPIPGPWFRWADQHGIPVVESVWWSDGPLHQHAEHLHVEVGGGWLVLITERGFEEIKQWAMQLSRGGVVRRSKGWHGDSGRSQAVRILSLG